MPRKTHEKMKAETIEKLMISARKSFFENGYAATSMDDLCADVNLTRGALYHHFGGKKGLLEAIVIQLHEEIGDEILKATQAIKNPLKAFNKALDTYLELSLRPDIQHIIFQDAQSVLGKRLKEIDREMFLDHLIEELQSLMDQKFIKKIDAPSFAVMLNGAIMEGALFAAGKRNKKEALVKVKETLNVLLQSILKID